MSGMRPGADYFLPTKVPVGSTTHGGGLMDKETALLGSLPTVLLTGPVAILTGSEWALAAWVYRMRLLYPALWATAAMQNEGEPALMREAEVEVHTPEKLGALLGLDLTHHQISKIWNREEYRKPRRRKRRKN